MKGIAASPGIAIGRALKKKEKEIGVQRKEITNVEKELEMLHEAIQTAKEDLKKIEEKTQERMGKKEAEIFAAHGMILEDPELISSLEKKIEEEKINAEAAVQEVFAGYGEMFAAMEDEYMRARAADIDDVGKRLIKILTGEQDEMEDLHEEVIIIARDLTPSDTSQLDVKKVLAFVTKEGSRTSHTAIMARSMGIPAVVGVGGDLLEQVSDEDQVIVDGNEGRVFINPGTDTTAEYEKKLKRHLEEKRRLAAFKDKEARTADGKRVEVAGNAGNLLDIDGVLEEGGEGIGLFRTEFLYMDRKEMPDEDEQFEVYRKAAEKMGERPLVIRTLDIGGDKDLPYLEQPEEMNPFLGYRAIRMCLDQPEVFKPQLRAILRASKYGNVKLMYPMIAFMEELQAANKLLKEAKNELKEEGHEYDNSMEVGIMVEVPAAVIIADELAAEVDFFSIGTNDLVQYTLAVDRINEKIAHLHTHYNPAVMRLIKQTIEAGHRAGIWVGMCGEAAGDELYLPFLLGVGLDEFSMSAVSILGIKEILSLWTVKEASELAEELLTLKTEKEIRTKLKEVQKAQK